MNDPLPTKYLAVPQNIQITLTIHNDSTFDANNLVGTTANNLLGSILQFLGENKDGSAIYQNH